MAHVPHVPHVHISPVFGIAVVAAAVGALAAVVAIPRGAGTTEVLHEGIGNSPAISDIASNSQSPLFSVPVNVAGLLPAYVDLGIPVGYRLDPKTESTVSALVFQLTPQLEAALPSRVDALVRVAATRKVHKFVCLNEQASSGVVQCAPEGERLDLTELQGVMSVTLIMGAETAAPTPGL